MWRGESRSNAQIGMQRELRCGRNSPEWPSQGEDCALRKKESFKHTENKKTPLRKLLTILSTPAPASILLTS